MLKYHKVTYIPIRPFRSRGSSGKDKATICIPIPSGTEGLIIGKGGETINGLKKLCPGVSRTRVNSQNPAQPTLEIWGTAEGCSNLESQVNKLIHRSINKFHHIPEFAITVFDGRPEDTACFEKCPETIQRLWLEQKDPAWTLARVSPGSRDDLSVDSEVASSLDEKLNLLRNKVSFFLAGIDPSTWSAQLKAVIMNIDTNFEDLRL